MIDWSFKAIVALFAVVSAIALTSFLMSFTIVFVIPKAIPIEKKDCSCHLGDSNGTKAPFGKPCENPLVNNKAKNKVKAEGSEWEEGSCSDINEEYKNPSYLGGRQ